METYAGVISGRPGMLIAAHSRKRGSIVGSSVRSGVCLLEITLGLHAGAVAGWVGGQAMGAACRAVFQPAYLHTLEEIKAWYFMPATFAFYGLYLGALLGVLIIHRYSQRMLKERIRALYEDGQERPEQLARTLFQNEKKIRWMLSCMIEKGELAQNNEK
jgi:hypothetical protein